MVEAPEAVLLVINTQFADPRNLLTKCWNDAARKSVDKNFVHCVSDVSGFQ